MTSRMIRGPLCSLRSKQPKYIYILSSSEAVGSIQTIELISTSKWEVPAGDVGRENALIFFSFSTAGIVTC